MDSEKVINMVFENCLPSELTQYDLNLPLMSAYEDNATGYDTSIKRYAGLALLLQGTTYFYTIFICTK